MFAETVVSGPPDFEIRMFDILRFSIHRLPSPEQRGKAE